MGLFGNLARIALAPVEVFDRMIVEPTADLVEELADVWIDD